MADRVEPTPLPLPPPTPRVHSLVISVEMRTNGYTVLWSVRRNDWPEGQWAPYSYMVYLYN